MCSVGADTAGIAEQSPTGPRRQKTAQVGVDHRGHKVDQAAPGRRKILPQDESLCRAARGRKKDRRAVTAG